MSSLPLENRTATPAPRAAAVPARYELAVPRDVRGRLATGWLALGVLALAASGIFSILLVASRTPKVQSLIPIVDFFHLALVVHVDLSVLVWFLAFGGALWSLAGTPRAAKAGWAALALAAAGTAALCVAPFVPGARALLANYVPVIDNGVFLAGLVTFAAGIALLVVRGLTAVEPVGTRPDGAAALRFGLNAAAVAAGMAIVAFAWSYATVPGELQGRPYYELLFWGGGHVLQFAFTLLMLVGWLALASASGLAVPLSPRIAMLAFAIALAAVFATPFAYLAFDVASVEHQRMHTWLMRLAGGFAIPPIALAIAWAAARRPPTTPATRPLRNALLASMALFAAGGVIGFLIRGPDVRIPAHYHGCIVGVTLAMMGLAYHLLPRLGFGEPRSRLAAWQPVVYGAGQLMHIVGLVWSGGYGVERKVAGAAQVLRTPQEVAGMGLMGAGGLLAVLGGLAFVVVVIQALRRRGG